MDTKKEVPDRKNGDGAHTVWSRKTPDGKPKAERIETFAQQKDFCRREGLICPTQA